MEKNDYLCHSTNMRDLSEMVLHFIETFMNENPLLYSEANFNQLIFQAVYNDYCDNFKRYLFTRI